MHVTKGHYPPPRQGMAVAKKKEIDQRNNGSNPQHGLENRPMVANRPMVKAQWKPTGNSAGAELVQDPLPEQIDAIVALASPSRFDPISYGKEAFLPLEELNRQSTKPKEQKEKNCPSSLMDRIVEQALAGGTLYVNAAKRGTERGGTHGPKHGETNASSTRPPPEQTSKGAIKHKVDLVQERSPTEQAEGGTIDGRKPRKKSTSRTRSKSTS